MTEVIETDGSNAVGPAHPIARLAAVCAGSSFLGSVLFLGDKNQGSQNFLALQRCQSVKANWLEG